MTTGYLAHPFAGRAHEGTRVQRRATEAAPKASPKPKVSKVELGAVVLVLLVAVAGVLYYVVYKSNSGNYYGEQIDIQIGGRYLSTPATYYPQNFTVNLGEHITLVIQNSDNLTHGLAIPSFGLDTGQIKPNGTATLSFVASKDGNYSYSEPSEDCGGGNCDAGQSLNGWFLVQSS